MCSLCYSFFYLSSWHQDSVDGVRLLSVSISVFGARKIVRELFIENEDGTSDILSDNRDRELDPGHFMQVFKETFVPWCLHEYNYSTSVRLDLLLTLLNDECFHEQWHAVISYAANSKHFGSGAGSVDSNHLIVLAMLLEKARDEITKRKVGNHSSGWQGSQPDHWHHELLESISVAIACSLPPFGTSDTRFMRYVNRILKRSHNTYFLVQETHNKHRGM